MSKFSVGQKVIVVHSNKRPELFSGHGEVLSFKLNGRQVVYHVKFCSGVEVLEVPERRIEAMV